MQGKESHGDENIADQCAGDPTAPFNETEAFDNIWEALRWKQIRTRVPICFKKTIRNRYMLANLIYFGYAIGILVIDFNPVVNGTAGTDNSCPATGVSLDDPITANDVTNKMYLGRF